LKRGKKQTCGGGKTGLRGILFFRKEGLRFIQKFGEIKEKTGKTKIIQSRKKDFISEREFVRRRIK